MQRTEIATLGKVALVHRLYKLLPERLQPTTLHAQGDDAAVLATSSDERLLLSNTLMLEGIHFDLTYTPLKHLGYKAITALCSEIYAMNGWPTQITLSLGLSARFSVEDVEELLEGAIVACQRNRADLVKIDVTSSLTGLSLALSGVGRVQEEAIAYRSGARPTDLICLTGDLGAAYMGLQLLEREKRVFAGEEVEVHDPDFAGHEYILERQLRPQSRGELIHRLAEASLRPSAMIDVVDGLSSALLHLAHDSGVGIRIYEDRLPIDFETARMAEEFNLNVSTVALSGGEDYELLFTLPLGMLDEARSIDGLRIIGHVTEASLGSCLVTRDGGEIELRAQDWHRSDA